MKQILTNIPTHFDWGIRIAIVVAGLQRLVNLIPNTQFQIAWMAFLACIITSMVVEKNQAKIAYEVLGISIKQYLRTKWLDCIVDVLACVLATLFTLGALGAL